MAKKTGLENLFQRTEPTDQAAQPEDKITATGVGLRESEWARLAQLAQEMGTTKHALAAWAVRDFLRRYDAGEIETHKRPTLPGI